MKLRTLTSWLCLLPLAAFGCSGDDQPTGSPLTDGGGDVSILHPGDGAPNADAKVADQSAPEADVKADVVVDVAPAEAAVDAVADIVSSEPDVEAEAEIPEPAAIDSEQLRAAAVQLDARAVSVLPSLKGLFNLFVEDDPTLRLDASTGLNADAVNLRLGETTESACPQKVASKNGDTVSVTFPGCTVNDLYLDGQVTVTVSRDAANWLTVTFALTELQINNRTVNGTVTVKTPDLVTYPTSVALKVTDLGELTFEGTGALSMLDGGTLAGKVTGSGKVMGAGADAGAGSGQLGGTIVTNGWTCKQQGWTQYDVTNLTRSLGSCYASDGQLVLRKTYRCEKQAVLRNPVQTITTTATVQWLPTTPSDKTVSVTLANSIADASTSVDAHLVTLGGTCDFQRRSDGGVVEAGAEASSDAEAGADAADADSGGD